MIVSIILLITGFVIIILIYSSIGWEGMADKQVCHLSVIERATMPQIAGAQTLIPLNCKTGKICVRGKKLFKKGKCKEFENEKKVNYVDVEKIEDVEKLISDEILDCWTMMGEGKVSLFSQYWANTMGIGDIYSTGVICSRIAFDETTLKEKGIDLSGVDVEDYMTNHNIPGKNKTYNVYISEQKGKINPRDLFGIEESDEEMMKENIPQDSGKEKEIAILFTQISAPTNWGSLKNIGTALFGGAALAPGIAFTGVRSVGKVCTSGGYQAIGCALIATVLVGGQQLNVLKQKSVSEEYCGDISTGKEARRGCSVVRAVNYNLEDINKYCSVIEGKN